MKSTDGQKSNEHFIGWFCKVNNELGHKFSDKR